MSAIHTPKLSPIRLASIARPVCSAARRALVITSFRLQRTFADGITITMTEFGRDTFNVYIYDPNCKDIICLEPRDIPSPDPKDEVFMIRGGYVTVNYEEFGAMTNSDLSLVATDTRPKLLDSESFAIDSISAIWNESEEEIEHDTWKIEPMIFHMKRGPPCSGKICTGLNRLKIPDTDFPDHVMKQVMQHLMMASAYLVYKNYAM